MHRLSITLALAEKLLKSFNRWLKQFQKLQANFSQCTNSGFKIKLQLSMVAELLNLFYRHPNFLSGPHIRGKSITMP